MIFGLNLVCVLPAIACNSSHMFIEVAGQPDKVRFYLELLQQVEQTIDEIVAGWRDVTKRENNPLHIPFDQRSECIQTDLALIFLKAVIAETNHRTGNIKSQMLRE